MAPGIAGQAPRISPLAAVTVATGDLDRARRFYSGVLGMAASLDRRVGAVARALSMHWGFGPREEVESLIFRQPLAGGAALVRVLRVPAGASSARPGYDSKYIGPLGFGFPMDDLGGREVIGQAMGFATSAGIRRMDFPRADGSTYNVGEIHFLAPDDILVLGVDRGAMAPVGPIDPALGIGGVAYASVLVADIEAFGRFLSEVLGLERRRKMSFESPGDEGGMRGLDRGERVAFEQWFSPGATTGYLVVMQRLDGERVRPETRTSNVRGVAMWTFETPSLEAAADRFKAFGGETSIQTLDCPGFGLRRSAILTTPDGPLVELLEAAA